MKFSIKDFFSSLQIWSHLLKQSLMENFIFCTVTSAQKSSITDIWQAAKYPAAELFLTKVWSNFKQIWFLVVLGKVYICKISSIKIISLGWN